MNLVFLDVDGVLNHSHWYGAVPGVVWRAFHSTGLGRHEAAIDPSRVERLQLILDQGSASIVVSSSWRKLNTRMEALLRVLEQGGIPRNKVVGRTPGISKALKLLGWNRAFALLAPRGAEIHAYLKTRADINQADSFVVLDDNNIVFRGFPHKKEIQYLNNHFVKTDPSTGLTQRDVDTAVRLLKGGPG